MLRLLPTSTDWHAAKATVANQLAVMPLSQAERLRHAEIEAAIHTYYDGRKIDLAPLMVIKDLVDRTIDLGHAASMRVLNAVVARLKARLFDRNDMTAVEQTFVLLDVLVKNCSYRIHLLVGTKVRLPAADVF